MKRCEPDNRQGDVQYENAANVLVEHSVTGVRRFSRTDSATFSAEDQVTLKRVAVILAVLVVVASTLGLICALAGG